VSELTAVTDVTFRSEVLEAPLPVLMDFYAAWCGPCKTIGPIVEEVAREHQGRLRVARLNVDEHPELAMAYGVMGLPTLLLFVDGKPAQDGLVGYATREQMESYLAQGGVE
jgi:thioredoxin 1